MSNHNVQWLVIPLLLTILAFVIGETAGHDQQAHEPTTVQAYIGPGAGIALLGSFLAVLVATLSAIMTIMTWPLRWIWRSVRGGQALKRAKVKRVVILGLDGLDPQLVDEFLEQGCLPNLERLRQQGTYMRLGTTWPPLSPVAWSSFSTGANPGKHNIFDFITRNPATYQPAMSSVRIHPPRRSLRLGKYRIPLSSPRIEGLRKSKPFWNVLGEAGIFSSVLRVPITFPPDKFRGVQLSAMCVPDLRGTQGMFTHFIESGEVGVTVDGDVGGKRVLVERRGNKVCAILPGPANPLREGNDDAQLSFQVGGGKNGDAILTIDGTKVQLKPHQFSAWLPLRFSLAPGIKVSGVCRFYLKRFEHPFEMYCTPINIDPDRPVMPISHPRVYANYLAKQLGTFATLGLAEDTWSLSEGVMSEEAFLEQAYSIDTERQNMFFDALRRVRRGMVVCVFDAPDRIQHMFWRFLDKTHPARGNDPQTIETHQETIRQMYIKMDELVGRTVEVVGEDNGLLVMSDHGFKPFRRSVDLNAWLFDRGYLKLKGAARTSDQTYLKEVDWSRTRAYAMGLAGIFVNQRDREAQGIVAAGEDKRRLVQQLSEELSGLQDTECGVEAIREAVPREKVYSGPYVTSAPDVIVGYNVGYRVSWESVVGKCGPQVFSDNTKAWSGDHCIHPALVPGVLFSNLHLGSEQANIIDLAPTTLELLGVPKPSYMDGKSLLKNED